MNRYLRMLLCASVLIATQVICTPLTVPNQHKNSVVGSLDVYTYLWQSTFGPTTIAINSIEKNPLETRSGTSLTIVNHHKTPIFVRLYYVETNLWGSSTGPANAVSNVIEINPLESCTTYRPGHKFGCNRELIMAENQALLLSNLGNSQYNALPNAAAGWRHGTIYHIISKKGKLKGYDALSWNLKFVCAMLEGELASLKEHYNNHPYSTYQAMIRPGTMIAPEEEIYLTKRMPRVRATLEQLFDTLLSDDEVPRIAVCMSGGGMRAAMCSYGLFEGLRTLKLINALTYASALSGSTWFLSHYIACGASLKVYKELMMHALTQVDLFNINTLTSVLWPKYVFGQHTSIVDLYGVYLSHTFFNHIAQEPLRQKITLSMLAQHLGDGVWPFPIFTAGETTEPFNWCAFTPYEFSCDALNFSIPIWSFGRRFKEGRSIDCAPEPSLGFLMGIWGLALSGSLEEMLEVMEGKLDKRLYSALDTILSETGLDNLRFASIKIANPLYHIKGAPFSKRKHLIFVDGGYGYNLPLPALLHPQRHADIIIVLDVSENVHDGCEDLRKAEAHLKSLGIPLPNIDYHQATTQPVSIFTDYHNPAAPTIVYVPPVKNNRYDRHFDPAKKMSTTYPSARFIYSRNDVERLTGLISFNIVDNKELLYNAIRERIQLKQQTLQA